MSEKKSLVAGRVWSCWFCCCKAFSQLPEQRWKKKKKRKKTGIVVGMSRRISARTEKANRSRFTDRQRAIVDDFWSQMRDVTHVV